MRQGTVVLQVSNVTHRPLAFFWGGGGLSVWDVFCFLFFWIGGWGVFDSGIFVLFSFVRNEIILAMKRYRILI